MAGTRRDDDLIREVEELRAQVLALADDDSAHSRREVADDLTALIGELKARQRRLGASSTQRDD